MTFYDELLTTDLLDQLGRDATRPTVRTEALLRRPAVGAHVEEGGPPSDGPEAPPTSTDARAQRSPLPASLPRPVKLARGRTHEVPPPAHVRVMGAELEHHDRDNIARKLGMKLGKFASSIERITVRLSDANGPKGGRDQICQIKVVLSGRPSVVDSRKEDSALQSAIDRARKTAALAVRRSVHRRRLKAQHHRGFSAAE